MKSITVITGLCLVFVFVWERVDVVRLGYHVERLKAEKISLERERDQLQVKFSALTAPERIAKAATDKLGMVPPQQGQVFIVHPQQDRPQSSPPLQEMRIARTISAGRGDR
jgi:cell division protein FtsL